MERNIYQHLLTWKHSARRKPLVLNGARQVGKTYALKAFGKQNYDWVAYFNFEKDEKLAGFFESSLDPKELIKLLSIHAEISIEPERTLIVFDEIQECARALNSLKYFCEEAGQYHVAAAGSLLGVKIARGKGFPVGKVNFLPVGPLSFFEFLSATGHQKLRAFVEENDSVSPIPGPLHDKLIEQLKFYFFVGGMPEAVAEYANHGNLGVVREVHQEILAAYERDFAKHAPPSEVMKITTVWKQVHKQLAKENRKFIFSAIRQSARGRDYEEAIRWLLDAGLILQSHWVETPKFPLSAYADASTFKLFLLDVGLLGAQSGLSAQVVIHGHEMFTEFKGALTENYVAQELKVSGHPALYYWSSHGMAEVDFLIEKEHEVYPLEVKSGDTSKKKSLVVYGQKYEPKKLLRTTLMNLKEDGNIRNHPLYMVCRV